MWHIEVDVDGHTTYGTVHMDAKPLTLCHSTGGSFAGKKLVRTVPYWSKRTKQMEEKVYT